MNTMRTPTPTLRRSLTACAVGILALGVTSCGSDTETVGTEAPVVETTVPPTTVPPTTGVPLTEVTVTGQWARTSPMMASMGAAYLTITSPVDDRLLSADVDAAVADHAEVHEVVMVEPTDTTMGMGSETTMGMGSGTTMAMGGEMTMREVDHIDLMAGMPLELKPGGFHIMLIDLVAPLEVGTSISITLHLETAGDIVVDVPVLDEAP